jgi:hypothetical protein
MTLEPSGGEAAAIQWYIVGNDLPANSAYAAASKRMSRV